LPEPLTAKACSSLRAAPAHCQLEKQVCCSCSVLCTNVKAALLRQISVNNLMSASYNIHIFCSQLTQVLQSVAVSAVRQLQCLWCGQSCLGQGSHTFPVGCLPAVSHGSFDVLASHMLLNSQSVWRSTQFNLPPRDTRSIDKQAQKLKPESAGKQWFDLPAQQLTDETRRDLKLLQLRGTFDPKRFYKSSDHKKGLPKFFQIGTVVEASADFYSGMLKIPGPCCCKCMILLSDV